YTFFAGIRRMPAGSAFEIEADGRLRSWRYWSLDNDFEKPEPDPVAHFAHLFEDSVRLRMRSDLPVGVLLSGGMDSSSILCSMARHHAAAGATQPPLAFSYNVKEFDESEYVHATIARTGADLVSLVRGDVGSWDQLGRVIAAQDEPTHSLNVMAQDGLMELARRHDVTVVLTGEGADETAGGYPTYFPEYWYSLLKHGRAGRMLK